MHQPTGHAAEGFAYATLKLLLFGVCIISWSCAEQQDDGDHQDGQEDEFRGDPLMDYCSCMLNRCHDGYHATWGEDHLASEAACLEFAAGLAQAGEAVTQGDYLECRQHFCDAAEVNPEGSDDPANCPQAFGEQTCIE